MFWSPPAATAAPAHRRKQRADRPATTSTTGDRAELAGTAAPEPEVAWAIADGTPHFGKKLRKFEQLKAGLEGTLEVGEKLLGVFTVNRLRPVLDGVAITDRRVLAYLSVELPGKIRVSVPAQQISAVEITSSMVVTNTVTLTMKDGSTVGLGALLHKADGPAVRGLIGAAMALLAPAHESASDPVAVQAPAGSRSVGFTTVKLAKRDPATPVERDAIAAGFPAKGIDLAEQIAAEIDVAVEASAAGDILVEERHLWKALQLSERAGVFGVGRGRKWVETQIRRRAAVGDVRRDSTHIVTVETIEIRNDRILQNGICRLMDGQVDAAVEMDGQLLESHRPTLTRMAMGSVLPGSALIVGLATAKKTTNDTRHARFLLVHPDWAISVRVSPEEVPKLRPMATRVNAVVKRLAEQAARSEHPATAEPVDAIPGASAPMSFAERMEGLERIAAMRQGGVITEAEAEQLKAELLRS